MAKVIISIWGAAIFLFAALAQAGDETAPTVIRREFRQSTVYPYTFQPVSYLESGGPKQMRFARAEAECAHRDAPALPSPTPVPVPDVKTTEETAPKPGDEKTITTTATSTTMPSPIPGLQPAYPPNANAPAAGSPDLTQMPEEVMSYFKNPYNSGPRGPHLFDPIFEPGYHEGPASKATYKVTDKP